MWEETVSFQTTGNNVNNAEQWLACALYVDYLEPRQKKEAERNNKSEQKGNNDTQRSR